MNHSSNPHQHPCGALEQIPEMHVALVSVCGCVFVVQVFLMLWGPKCVYKVRRGCYGDKKQPPAPNYILR